MVVNYIERQAEREEKAKRRYSARVTTNASKAAKRLKDAEDRIDKIAEDRIKFENELKGDMIPKP